MDLAYIVDHYLEGTTSSVMTRGVLLGFQRKRPNQGAVLLTQLEYRRLVEAFIIRGRFSGVLQHAGLL
jgi:hypothetical protein